MGGQLGAVGSTGGLPCYNKVLVVVAAMLVFNLHDELDLVTDDK